MRVKELFQFMEKRHGIWKRREAGEPKPWTADPILLRYRFCNVYRELDMVTKWFATKWRAHGANDLDLWFAALVYRLVNLPEVAEELKYPVPFSASHFVRTLHFRRKRGLPMFNGAYIVSTNGVKMDKAEYLADHVLKPAWDRRDEVRWLGVTKDSLDFMHTRLCGLNGVGSFIAAQVIADIKYAPDMQKEAHDWWTFAASGPGSRRGLNRVLGYQPDNSWTEAGWRKHLAHLMVEVAPLVKAAQMPRLHAQDLQNCLCEFDKYERVRLGEGRPKARYNGGK